MSGTVEPPSLRGSARVLMLSTVVMATAAAAVLALGTQDARLLRLGVVAALWAAMLAAFTTARARREVSSRAEHADQLRAVYQLELGREVAARREHALTVERELRKQVELSQRREIVELRAELSALGVNLAQLLGGNSLVERVTLQAESTRLLPLPAHPRKFDDSNNGAPVAATAAAPSAAVTVGPTGPEFRFGPSRRETPSSNGQGRHGVPNRERSGTHNNGTGSHNNGSLNNGRGAARSPAAQAQRSVQDLLAAHGAASTPRRRRTHEDGPATRA
jgi:uncharacterized protein DUF6779